MADPVISNPPTILPFPGIDVPVFANDRERMQWALDQMTMAVVIIEKSGLTEASDPLMYNAYQRLVKSLALWQWWWSLVRF